MPRRQLHAGRRVPEPGHRRAGPSVVKLATRLAAAAAAMAGEWEQLAECVIRGLDPELFFPEDKREVDRRVFSACSACQVRQECLTRAMRAERGLDTKGRHGIWGGLSPRQRTRLANGRKVILLRPTRDRNRYKRPKATREAAPVVPLMRLQEPIRPARRSG